MAVYKNNVAIGQQYDTSEGSKLQVNGDVKANTFKGNLSGNATSATNATNDIEGTNIKEGYSKALAKDGGSSDILSNVSTNQQLFRSGLYSIQSKSVWYNLINVRHKNGSGDGIKFGMQMAKGLTDNNSVLMIRGQANGTWSDWENLYRAKTLYYNGSGTTGTVTLSETAANFKFLEIFFSNASYSTTGFKHERVFAPNGKQVILSWSTHDDGTIIFRSARYSISGTSITRVSETQYNTWNKTAQKGTETSIFEVIGYR